MRRSCEKDHGLPRPIPGRGQDNAHTAESAVGDYTTGRADPRKGAVRLPRGSAWRRFIALQRAIQRGKAPAGRRFVSSEDIPVAGQAFSDSGAGSCH